MNRIIFSVLLFVLPIAIKAQNADEVLKKVSDNIESINNISYRLISFYGEPDDSLFTSETDTYEFYTSNKKDSIVKALFYYTQNNEPDKVSLIYNGICKHTINWNLKRIAIDSLNASTISQLPYYPVRAPLLIRIKSVIDYSICNPNNCKIIFARYSDSTIVKINFPNHVMEFANMRPWFVQCPSIEPKDIHSSYTIWLNNKNMPFKFLREVRSQRSLDFIKELEIKDYNSNGILPDIYIPADFKYVYNGQQINAVKNDLELKKAPSFTLSNPLNNDLNSLEMYHGKAILLTFTGIGCGHCKDAIPFLNALKDKYKDFKVVGIETFVNKPQLIGNYVKSNKIQYDYLIANKEIKDAYNISGVPKFVILDNNYKIMKVIVGYSKGYTDEIISEEIRKLIE